jgi:DNA (cytosine-5)-methyltransferase 1
VEALRAVSLFSNCGAGDVGYRKAGFQFGVMAELDPRRLAVALRNHPGARGVPGDLRETWPHVVSAYREWAGSARPALLAACPPCQGMSSARGKRGSREDPDVGSRDPRNLLVLPIAHVASWLRPRAIVVENVPEFLTRKVRHPATAEPISAAKLLISLLEGSYQVFPILADLADWGVPQTRKRSFLTFVHLDEEQRGPLLRSGRTPYPVPVRARDHQGPGPFTLRQALLGLGLPSLDAGSADRAADSDRPLHSVPVWEDRRHAMVAAIPPETGRTAWQNDTCEACGERVDVGADDATCPLCGGPLLRPVVREADGTYRLVKGFKTSSYKRMRPDGPAPTITTATGHLGSHTTIHPWEPRLLSPLECAGLQTLPIDFDWGDALERWGSTNLREMIGEAVPPRFTHQHGLAVRGVLTGEWPVQALPQGDPRCMKAFRALTRAPRAAKKRRAVAANA